MCVDYESVSTLSALVTAVAAVITALTAVIAIPMLVQQSRQSTFSMKVENLLKKEEFFESEKMLAKRRKAANAIRKNKFGPEVDEILDFFEGIGLLMKKGALDPEMVWNDFSESAFGYWYSSRDYVERVRNSDRHYWGNFGHLIDALLRISNKKYRSTPRNLTKTELNNFLSAELKKTNKIR